MVSVYIDTRYDASTDFTWTAYGSWGIANASGLTQNSGVYVSGFETPVSGKPSSGSATFNGFIEGAAFVPNGTALLTARLNGSAQLVVNWSTGAITGSASGITATPFPLGSATAQAWNGLSFSGNITSGTTAFSGSTAVTGAPGTFFALPAGTSGSLNGQFFGLTAQEVGAIWSVHNGTSGASGYLVGK